MFFFWFSGRYGYRNPSRKEAQDDRLKLLASFFKGLIIKRDEEYL